MQEHVGTKFTDKDVTDYLWSTLNSGRVVPGYGHAVLAKPDPRFEALMDYASSRPEIANDPVFQLVKKNSEIAPGVLKQHGKTVCFLSYFYSPLSSYFYAVSPKSILIVLANRPTPIQTSIPPPGSSSTTTASTRRCTTPPPLA